MNKEVAIIGGGVVGGALSNGVSTLLPQSESPIINLVFAGASAFGATKVRGTTTKDNLLKGALMGSAVVQALTGIKKIADKSLSARLTGDGKATQFMKGAVGLACPYDEGLNGTFMGGDGQIYQYDENGLNGTFIDEAGNVFEMNNGLNGMLEDELYDNGLHGAESDVYGMEDEHGLNGIEEEELYSEIYQ
ncbi:hypothetical protein ACM55M_10680 [Flavobacterium sp. ZT3R25]|uniref:hypothetical protein n=1 Tax=Flavobacterium galactosi TaxID=3398735 RepID=UPI003A8B6564